MSDETMFDYAEIEAVINAVHGCLHIETNDRGIAISGFEEYETEFAGWSPTLHDIRIRVTTPVAIDDPANATRQDLVDDLDRHFEQVIKVAEIQQRRSDFAASIGLDKPIALIEKDDPFFSRIIVDRSHAERLLANESDPAEYLYSEMKSLYDGDTTYGGSGNITIGKVRIMEHEAGLVEYHMQADISSEIRAAGNYIAFNLTIGEGLPDASLSAAIGRPVQQFIDLPKPYADYYADRIIADIQKPQGVDFFFIELEKDFVTFGDLKG